MLETVLFGRLRCHADLNRLLLVCISVQIIKCGTLRSQSGHLEIIDIAYSIGMLEDGRHIRCREHLAVTYADY